MKDRIVQSLEPVLLVGGGDVLHADLTMLARLAGPVVAADGGADAALAAGLLPEAVIGDMDSISSNARARIGPDRLHVITEQDSTDFDKALRKIEAPLVFGAGFLGSRLDHQLAVQTVLVRHADRPCLLIGAEDLVFVAPPEIAMDLPPGSRFSLFPLRPVTGRSEGLHWPIDGIAFAPDERVGTSNQVADAGRVRLWMDGPGMLVITPREPLQPVVSALQSAARWPARETR